MLHVRAFVDSASADGIAEALLATGGVRGLARSTPEDAEDGVVLDGDVSPAVADEVVAILDEHLEPDSYLLTRQDVVTPTSARADLLGGRGGFAWVEVAAEARTYTRTPAGYLALMGAAGAIAAIGVIEASAIPIVGAMAISPDLLPICAVCVALVGGRVRMATGALLTLIAGLSLASLVAGALTVVLLLLGILPSDFRLRAEDLEPLIDIDYTTVAIALSAGVAGMIAFSTRASAAIGVAISVTTIPASSFLGVAFARGEVREGLEALLVLTTNVVLLLVSGAATLFVLRRAGKRRDLRPEGTVKPG